MSGFVYVYFNGLRCKFSTLGPFEQWKRIKLRWLWQTFDTCEWRSYFTQHLCCRKCQRNSRTAAADTTPSISCSKLAGKLDSLVSRIMNLMIFHHPLCIGSRKYVGHPTSSTSKFKQSFEYVDKSAGYESVFQFISGLFFKKSCR